MKYCIFKSSFLTSSLTCQQQNTNSKVKNWTIATNTWSLIHPHVKTSMYLAMLALCFAMIELKCECMDVVRLS
jgi:hypothetical protein